MARDDLLTWVEEYAHPDDAIPKVLESYIRAIEQCRGYQLTWEHGVRFAKRHGATLASPHYMAAVEAGEIDVSGSPVSMRRVDNACTAIRMLGPTVAVAVERDGGKADAIYEASAAIAGSDVDRFGAMLPYAVPCLAAAMRLRARLKNEPVPEQREAVAGNGTAPQGDDLSAVITKKKAASVLHLAEFGSIKRNATHAEKVVEVGTRKVQLRLSKLTKVERDRLDEVLGKSAESPRSLREVRRDR